MKKTSKTILVTVLLGTVGLNLAIDPNGRINLGAAKVGAQSTNTTGEDGKWKREEVSCIDDDDKEYAKAFGCFSGSAKECDPTSCPPQPPKTTSER